jgi:hypothetical protein
MCMTLVHSRMNVDYLIRLILGDEITATSLSYSNSKGNMHRYIEWWRMMEHGGG